MKVLRRRRIAERRPRPISEAQKRCIIDATVRVLTHFPRGFAQSKAGPFYDGRTVQALLSTGALRVVRDTRQHAIGVTARAA